MLLKKICWLTNAIIPRPTPSYSFLFDGTLSPAPSRAVVVVYFSKNWRDWLFISTFWNPYIFACYLNLTNIAFKFIILFQFTSNTITFVMHPTLAKLAENRITVYTFTSNQTKKIPFFPNLSNLSKTFLALLATDHYFHLFYIYSQPCKLTAPFQASSDPFKPSGDSANAKSSE